MWRSIAITAQAACYATWIHDTPLCGVHLLKCASMSEAPSAEKSEFSPMLLSVDDASLLVSWNPCLQKQQCVLINKPLHIQTLQVWEWSQHSWRMI